MWTNNNITMEGTIVSDGDNEKVNKDDIFVETGRPLTMMEWDDETREGIIDRGESPPDDDIDVEMATPTPTTTNNNNNICADDENNNDKKDDTNLYNAQAIHQREENASIIALYTPGRTYGSITYVFPKIQAIASGHSLPMEDRRSYADAGGAYETAGPRLDSGGYVTTNKAGMDRMLESASYVLDEYVNRFEVVLPAGGEVVDLGDVKDVDRRRDILGGSLDQYKILGKVYEELGILSS